jgi:hypothetical protein
MKLLFADVKCISEFRNLWKEGTDCLLYSYWSNV